MRRTRTPRRGAPGARALLAVATAAGLAASLAAAPAAAPPADGPRTVRFTARRFTQPSVGASADGAWLAIAVLGELYLVRLADASVEPLGPGGASFDWAPRFSPLGLTVACAADGPDGIEETYLIELPDGRPRRLTLGSEVEGPPAWSPDGESVIVARRNAYAPGPRRAAIWQIDRRGGATRLTPPDALWRDPFVLPDGRIGAVTDFRRHGEARSALCLLRAAGPGAGGGGAPDTLAVVAGNVRRPVATPDGRALVFRLRSAQRSTLVRMALASPALELLAELERPADAALAPTHDVLPDGRVVAGIGGRIVIIDPRSGARETLELTVPLRFELPARAAPERRVRLPWERGRASLPLAGVHGATLDRSGRLLLVSAVGELWLAAGGAPFERLTETPGLELEPRLAPAGDALLFTAFRRGRATVFRRPPHGRWRARPLVDESAAFYAPEWTADGNGILLARWRDYRGSLELLVPRAGAPSPGAGGGRRLIGLRQLWNPAPSAAAARGAAIYVNLRDADGAGLWCLPPAGGAAWRPVSDPAAAIEQARVSPDGRFCAYRRGGWIEVAPVAGDRVDLRHGQQLGPGREPRFSPGEVLTWMAHDTLMSVAADALRAAAGGGATAGAPALPHSRARRLGLELSLATAPPPLLIEHLRLLEAGGDTLLADRSLLIRDGRIVRVAPSDALWPERAERAVQRVDALGAVAIPGLIDLHVHLGTTPPEALLAYGITAVRDVGANAALVCGIAEAIATGVTRGPHLFYAGEVFEGGRPFWGDRYFAVTTAAEIPLRLADLEGYGVDLVKLYPTLPRPLARTVYRQAHAAGLRCAAHAGNHRHLVNAVLDGADSIEHGLAGGTHEDMHQLLAAAAIDWVPTTTIHGVAERALRRDPAALRDRRLEATVPRARLEQALAGATLDGDLDAEQLGRLVERQLEAIGDARRCGCRILTGTDAGTPGVFHGVSLHWELEALVEAGLSPAAALAAATREAARALGAERDLGTLEPGKIADLVLLDADPLIDIRNTRSIWRVVSRGQLFTAYELIGELEEREP